MGGVEAAFNMCRLCALGYQRFSVGPHAQLVLAIMRENMGGVLHPISPGMATDGIEIGFNWSGGQGGTETTCVRNSAMYFFVEGSSL